MKTVMIAFFIISCYSAKGQERSAYDSTDLSIVAGRHWIRDMGEVGLILGGDLHGLGFGLTARYWYLGVTCSVNDLMNVDQKPDNVNHYAPPLGNYKDVGFRSAFFHLTGDITVPLFANVAFRFSAGANQKTMKYLSQSGITQMWYDSNKKEENLYLKLIYGGGWDFRAWSHLTLGFGYMSDLGGFITIGGLL